MESSKIARNADGSLLHFEFAGCSSERRRREDFWPLHTQHPLRKLAIKVPELCHFLSTARSDDVQIGLPTRSRLLLDRFATFMFPRKAAAEYRSVSQKSPQLPRLDQEILLGERVEERFWPEFQRYSVRRIVGRETAWDSSVLRHARWAHSFRPWKL